MFYYIENEVIDNDRTKTNTGECFLCNEYIAWSHTHNLWLHIGGITKKPHNTKSIYKSSDFPSKKEVKSSEKVVISRNNRKMLKILMGSKKKIEDNIRKNKIINGEVKFEFKKDCGE